MYDHTTAELSQGSEIKQKVAGKSQNIWNRTPLNNTWVKEEVSKEIYKEFELNENKNTAY